MFVNSWGVRKLKEEACIGLSTNFNMALFTFLSKVDVRKLTSLVEFGIMWALGVPRLVGILINF